MALALTFAMIVGMIVEPVQISAAQSNDAVEVAAESDAEATTTALEGKEGQPVEPEVPESGDGTGGEVTPPVEDTSYTVKIKSPEDPFYPGEVSKAFVIESVTGQPSGQAEDIKSLTVQWSCSGNASINDKTGELTVNEGAKQGDKITVTATVQDIKGISGSGSTEISVSERPKYSISGTVQDIFNKSGIKDVTVKLVGTDMQATTDAMGNFTIKNVIGGKGTSYTLQAEKAGYTCITEDLTIGENSGDVIGKNIMMESTQEISIKPTEILLKVEESETVSLTCPQEWEEEVTWSVDNSDSVTIQGNGKSITVIGRKASDKPAVLTAQAHGKSANVNVTVSKVQVGDRGLKIETAKEERVCGNPIKFTASFKDAKGNPIKNEKVVFDISSSKERIKGEYILDDEGQASVEHKFSAMGSYRVTCTIKNGDKYVNNKVETLIYVTGKEGQEIKITLPKDITYGGNVKIDFNARIAADSVDYIINEKNWKVQQIEPAENEAAKDISIKIEEDTIEPSKEIDGMYNVKGTISFKAGQAGKTKLSMTYAHRKEGTPKVYTDAKADISFDIQKKTLHVSNIKFKEKIYNKDYDVEAQEISFKDDEIVFWGNVKDTITVVKSKLFLNGKDVYKGEERAEYGLNVKAKGFLIQLDPISDSNYEINLTDLGQSTEIKQSISPRPIEIFVTAATRQYGKSGVYEIDEEHQEPQAIIKRGKPEGTGIIWGDAVNDTLGVLDTSEDNTVITEEGDPLKKLVPTVNKRELSKDTIVESHNRNYVYTVTEDDYGDLTIIPKKNVVVEEYLNFSGSYYYKEKEKEHWVKGIVDKEAQQDTVLNLTLSNTEMFDGVKVVKKPENIEVKKDNSSNNLKLKFFADENVVFEERTVTLSFYKDKKQCSEPVTVTFCVDTKAPVATFNLNGEYTGLDSLLKDITFGNYDNKTFYANVNLTDDNELIEGVGLNSEKAWEALALKVSEDISEEKLCDVIEKTTEGWIEGEGGNIQIPVGKGKSVDDIGYYVVVVKTYDQLGNTMIYTSNGLVIENKEPEIIIPDLTDKKYNLEYMKDNENTIKISGITVNDYSNDSNSSEEKPSVSSGVDKISYIICKKGPKGEVLEKLKEEILYPSESDVKEVPTWEELQKDKPFTKIELQKAATFQITTKDDKEKADADNVYLRVIASDNSGNEVHKDAKLNIDLTRPTIKVKYENAVGTHVKNKNYFNGNRIATITLKDRNLDLKQAYFNFSLQDKEGNYKYAMDSVSLGELKNLTDIQGNPLFLSVKSEETDVNDITTATVSLEFNGEDHYKVAFECEDTLGNKNSGTDFSEEGDAANTEFTIDKTAPVVKQIYSVNGQEITMPSGERIYQKEPMNYKVYIDEHNFGREDLVFGASSKTQINQKGENDNGNWNPDEDMMSVNKWQPNGLNGITEQRFFEYTFEAQGNYTHEFSYEDLAGNKAIYKDFSGNKIENTRALFTVDHTSPTGTVKIKGVDCWKELLEDISFGLFSPSTVDVEVTGSDHTSPVHQVQYTRAHDKMTRDELEAYNSWSYASKDRPNFAEFSVSPNEQFVVYTKVTDYAGNYEFFSSNGMIVDSTKPAPVVTITNLSQSQNGIFNEDVTLQIDVEDPTVGDTYSGLEKVWYNVSSTGNVKTGQTIELLNNSKNKKQGNKTFSQVITIPANVYNSNDVKVQAFAQDFSGNKGDSEITELKIDVTNPKISVSWDLNNPSNGKYYKDTRTATVTVTDRNFDKNNVRFNITNTDGTEANISSWSSSSDIGISDNATSTCQVSFPADGDYTFTLGCTDLAGNSGEYGQTDEFTIDKTIPTITVSYDNNDARNGNYFKEARTATITVREHNFNSADVRAAVTAALQGKGISAPSVSSFSGSGDVHTATVRYATDGDYTFDVDYIDMAGNQAADYAQDSFTVDLTNPEVEIVDINDKSANNDVVAPGVKATDVNYDAQNVTINVTGANNGKVDVGKVVSAIENGQSIKMNDFAREEKMDDLYKLTAKSVDKAGNETEKSVMFSVNRYGSVYVLDDDTWADKGGWLDTKDYTYIRKEQDLGVVEYNVDTIEANKITVNRDGELETLKENQDYTVKSSGSDAQWKENHYVIDAENFAEEGNYNVIFNTRDRANNTMNNTSVKKSNKNLPIEFTVDKTAPTVVVSGIEDGGQYRLAEKNMTVDAKDNLALARVTISVDGKETVYDAEKLREINGIIETAVSSANSWQNIEITSEDAAGNQLGQTKENDKAQPVVMKILVTPNIVIQYYMNKPLFYGSIAAIAIMIGLIVFLIWRKKKEETK